MKDSTIVSLSIPISIIVYLILFCSMNRHNCVRNKSLNLPLGFSHIFSPFIEFLNGRIGLFFKLLFTIQNPWLFIIIGLILSGGYVLYRRLNSTDLEDDEES
jgi:hypothetical protein